DHAIPHARMPRAQRFERLAHRGRRPLERDDPPAVRERLERPGDQDADSHFYAALRFERPAVRPARLAAPFAETIAAFTQTTGGNPPAASFQFPPSSRDTYTFPLRVPK